MPDQAGIVDMGGTMRLGAYPCAVKPGTLAAAAYGTDLISERHRHRFEMNNTFRDQIEAAGLTVCGTSPNGRLVEMVELPRDVHPWFVAGQFHPEFKSRPTRPHPLVRDFVAAAVAYEGER
jgi:CTP synthase